MLKVYRHQYYLKHTIFIDYNGVPESLAITFDGGTRYPELINGSFTTSDVKIQRAIESHPSFGKLFVEQVYQQTTGDLSNTVEVQQVAAPKYEEVEVVNFQQARKFLVDNFDLAIEDFPNREAVDNKAKELNVKFIYKK